VRREGWSAADCGCLQEVAFACPATRLPDGWAVDDATVRGDHRGHPCGRVLRCFAPWSRTPSGIPAPAFFLSPPSVPSDFSGAWPVPVITVQLVVYRDAILPRFRRRIHIGLRRFRAAARCGCGSAWPPPRQPPSVGGSWHTWFSVLTAGGLSAGYRAGPPSYPAVVSPCLGRRESSAAPHPAEGESVANDPSGSPAWAAVGFAAGHRRGWATPSRRVRRFRPGDGRRG